MGLIVLDTSVLVDHLRGRAEASEAIEAASGGGETLVASVLTKVELLAGTRSRERRAVRVLFDRLPWVAVSDDIAERAGALARRYRRSHQGVDVVDFVIAATVEALGGVLWTRNLRHFPMLAALQAPY